MIMWFGISPDRARARMFYKYLEECRKREFQEMPEKKDYPWQTIWTGEKLRKLIASFFGV